MNTPATPFGKRRPAQKVNPLARRMPIRPQVEQPRAISAGSTQRMAGAPSRDAVAAPGTVRTIDALRRRNPPCDGTPRVLTVEGYRAPHDGGAGVFVWTAGRAFDDGGTVIVPVTMGRDPGFWLRLFNGAINIKWFGARGDGIHDPHRTDQQAIQAAIDAAAFRGGGTVYVPLGTYLLTAPLQMRPNVQIAHEVPPTQRQGRPPFR